MCHIDDKEAFFWDTGDESEPRHSPEQPLDCTSLDAKGFIWSMNDRGWLPNGEFVALLSTIGYHFREDDGKLVAKKDMWHVAQALSLLIFEV